MDVHRLDSLDVNLYAPSTICDNCGSFGHATLNYQVRSPFTQSSSEQVSHVSNFQLRANHNPYSNTYTPS